MKPTASLARFAALVGALSLITVTHAANLYWDGGDVNIGTNGDGASAGGAGTWSTAISNWDNGAAPHVAWVNANNDTAIFGGTAGTVTLGTTITANGLNFTSTGYSVTSSTLTLAGTTPTINTDTGVTATISSIVTGSAAVGTTGLFKDGAGTLILSGNKTYTGNTVVNAGVLELTTGTATNVTTYSGSGTLRIGSNGAVQSWNSNATMGAGFTGVLDIQTLNTTTNRVHLLSDTTHFVANLGDLNVGSATAIYINSSTLQFDMLTGGGKIGYNNTNGFMTLTIGANNGSDTFTGIIANESNNTGNSGLSLIKIGTGTQVLGGANNFIGNGGGGTTIQNGALQLTNGDNRIAANSTFTIGAATTSGKLVLGSTGLSGVTNGKSDLTVAGLTSTGLGGSIVGGNSAVSTLTVNLASGSNTFAGTLGGAGANENNLALTKSGAGTLTLSGANSYTGKTTIKAGTLALSGSGSIASSSIVVGDTGSSGTVLSVTAISGGTFTVDASQTVSGIGTVTAGAKVVSVGGALAPGNSAGLLSVSTSGGLQFLNNAALNIELTRGLTPSAGTNYDQLSLNGSLNINTGADLNLSALGTGIYTMNSIYFLIANDGSDAIAGEFQGFTEGGQITFDGQLFNVTYDADSGANSFVGGNDFALMAVPEPTVALLGSLGLLALLRRRRN